MILGPGGDYERAVRPADPTFLSPSREDSTRVRDRAQSQSVSHPPLLRSYVGDADNGRPWKRWAKRIWRWLVGHIVQRVDDGIVRDLTIVGAAALAGTLCGIAATAMSGTTGVVRGSSVTANYVNCAY